MDELVFNELSFENCTKDNFSGFFIKWSYVKTLLRMNDFPRIRFTPQQIIQRNKSGYSLNDIIQNSTLDELEMKILYSHINDEPFINDTYSDKLVFQKKPAYGLTDSYYKNIPCISIPSDVHWNSFIITADELDISEEAEIIKNPVEVLNIGDLQDYHGTWFEKFIPLPYSDIDNFTEYITSHYKNILLSKSVIDFLYLNQSQTIMEKLETSVQKLDKYCSHFWKRENVMWNQIKDLGLNVRPESDQTMSKYGNQRIFKNENSRNEKFSYHFNMPNDHRAYLKAITDKKRFFIANIVSHLDTVTG